MPNCTKYNKGELTCKVCHHRHSGVYALLYMHFNEGAYSEDSYIHFGNPKFRHPQLPLA